MNSEDQFISIGLLLMTSVLILAFEKWRGLRLDLISAFSASLLLFYCFIPSIIILWPEAMSLAGGMNWTRHFHEYQHAIPIAAAAVPVFFLCFAATYVAARRIRPLSDRVMSEVLSTDPQRYRSWAFIFLAFGTLSFFIYSSAVGGPVSALMDAQLIRSGYIDKTNALTFFKHFMRIVFFALYILICVRATGPLAGLRQNLTVTIALLICLIVAWAYAGRGVLLVLLVSLLLCRQAAKTNSLAFGSFLPLAFVGILSILVIAFMRPLLLMLGGQEVEFLASEIGEIIVGKLIQGLSLPMISLTVALQDVDVSGVLAGSGMMLSVLDLVPKSILGVDYLPTANRANTEMFGYITDERVYTITSGTLAYFVHEYHWLGVGLGGMISGFVVTLGNNLFNTTRNHPAFLAVFIYFIIKMPLLMLNGDPASLFKNEFVLIFALAWMIFAVPRMGSRSFLGPRVPALRKAR